jgi:ABC-2 type transport system permease protein
VARLDSSSSTSEQFAAIGRVRWQLFVNSLRTVRGRLELVARVFMFLGFGMLGLGGSVGLGAAAWYFASHRRPDFLALLFWPVFLFWQFFPVLASAFSENIDSSNLLRFPLTFRSYFLVRIAFGSLEPATAVGILWSLGIVAGITAAAPRLFFVAALALLAFAVLNILLGRMIYVWVEKWLARRRTRELLGVIFFLFIISFQLINPLILRFGKGAGSVVTHFSAQALPLQRFLPPGLAADSIAGAIRGNFLRSFGDVLLQCFYAAIILWLLNLRLRAQYLGENLSEAVARTAQPAARGSAEHPGWNIPGVPGPIAAVVEKEFHYLSRSGPMLFTFVMPVVILVIFRFGSPRTGDPGGILARASDLAFPVGAAYTLLMLTNLVYNTFGGDAVGVQFFYLSPVRFREILLGKNLAHSLVIAIEIFLVWLGTCFLYRPPSAEIAAATITGVVFGLIVNLAAGNLLSLYTPKKIDYGTFGRQRASGTTAIASLGIQAVTIGLCALALIAARASGRIWVATLVFVFLIVLAAAGYILVLNQVDSVALKRREALITELSRA